MADVPVANPSKPSVILAPFETAVITKITTRTKSSHEYLVIPSPSHDVKFS